jgi:hypothetical protein
MESSGNQHEPNSFSENTSGQGKSAIVPKEIQGWNWGAFLLSWIWGLAHNVPLALLMFVPGVNIVMWFMLGAKGSAWAWQKKRWQSIEEFKKKQKTWSVAGFIAIPVVVLLGIAGSFNDNKVNTADVVGENSTTAEMEEQAFKRLSPPSDVEYNSIDDYVGRHENEAFETLSIMDKRITISGIGALYDDYIKLTYEGATSEDPQLMDGMIPSRYLHFVLRKGESSKIPESLRSTRFFVTITGVYTGSEGDYGKEAGFLYTDTYRDSEILLVKKSRTTNM